MNNVEVTENDEEVEDEEEESELAKDLIDESLECVK